MIISDPVEELHQEWLACAWGHQAIPANHTRPPRPRPHLLNPNCYLPAQNFRIELQPLVDNPLNVSAILYRSSDQIKILTCGPVILATCHALQSIWPYAKFFNTESRSVGWWNWMTCLVYLNAGSRDVQWESLPEGNWRHLRWQLHGLSWQKKAEVCVSVIAVILLIFWASKYTITWVTFVIWHWQCKQLRCAMFVSRIFYLWQL